MLARLAVFALTFAAAAASAQPAPDVVGTWELTASENVPYEDALVFARLTITPDRIRTVYVFLDPDDGELSARSENARYVVSAGQLVAREDGRVTVLDVVREGTVLRVHDLETDVVLTLREADPALALDPDLVGTWAGTRDGEFFAVRFEPDGRAEVTEGDDTDDGRYLVAGPYLVLGDDPARYTFARDADGRRQLVVEADGERTVLARSEN